MILPSFFVDGIVMIIRFLPLVGRLKSVGQEGLGFSLKTASLAP